MTDWKAYLRTNLPPLAADPAREEEIVDELAQHLTDREAELLASGASEEEAAAAVRAEVPDRQALAREIRRADRSRPICPPPPVETRGGVLVGFLQDAAYGLRRLLRSPAFAGAGLLILALGIGINAATFSVVKNVLLDPLPFRAPEQLMIVWRGYKGDPRIPESAPVSGPNFLDYRSQSRSFERLVAFNPKSMNLTGLGDPERLQGTITTAGLFELLDVQPSLGRTFRSEEERPGQHKVAVISDGFWSSRLGGDPKVLGRSLSLDGETYTIVGVMPPGFQHPCPWSVGRPTDIWIPLSLDKLEVGRDRNWLLVLGRLKPGVTRDAAQAEMAVISERLEQAYPTENERGVALVVPVREVLVGRLASRLWILMGASVLVLLVVCANVAGLFMVRAMKRQTEMAVRSSLGASRGRLIRQLMTESLPLFLIGGAASLLVSHAATAVLRALLPSSIPRIHEIEIDGWLVAVTFLLSLLVALVSGVVPVLAASRDGLTELLSQGRGASVASRDRGRRLIIVTQFALTLVLAHGAALMLRSYWTLRTMDLGFSADRVLTMRLDLSGPGYAEPVQVRAFFEEALGRIETLPGVRRAAAISRLPLEGGTNGNVTIEGREQDKGFNALVEVRVCTSGYFEAMGIPLHAGRTLTERDGAAGATRVVINQAMARRHWRDEDPIGKRFRFDQPDWLTVVGVVGDTRQFGLEAPARPEAYFPFVPTSVGRIDSFTRVRFLVIRSALDPASLVAAVRREILKVDKNQPVFDIRTAAQVVDASIAERRFNTILIGFFASTALVLVVAAIYALMALFVAQHTREIGVRMAFGATRGGVLRMILTQALRLEAIGAAIGLAGVAATANLTVHLVYGISPSDPATVAFGTLFLLAVGLLGSLAPALRATRVDPVRALGAE